jgi:glycosyltransferase involved in cell wall biosynthesis
LNREDLMPPIAGLPERTARESVWAAKSLDGFLYAEILSTAPLIVQAIYPSPSLPLGAASIVGPIAGGRPAHILFLLHWQIETPHELNELVDIAGAYRDDHSHHQLTFLCNTTREADLMQDRGFSALKLNHNCLVNDTLYTPKPDIEPIYDAVYNACLAGYKRHELAVEIERLALIYYPNSSPLEFHAEQARLAALMPKARFVNELTPDGCRWIPPQEVNHILAQSRVGLCLSKHEGAMRASAEYLFAGLSVVSTPSLGGRDTYFDDEFCIIAEPNPRSVREAVEALVTRNVSREYIRSRTLTRIDADRRRYIALVQDLIDRAGGDARFEDRFWERTHRGPTMMHWRSTTEFTGEIVRWVNLFDRAKAGVI